MNFDNELTYRNKRNGAVVYGGVPPESPDEWEHVYVVPANGATREARPAPAWDEGAVGALQALVAQWDAQAAHNADQGGDFWRGMVAKGRECADDLRRSLAVVREHHPVKPRREDMVEALYENRERYLDQADAVLDLLPGRSEAEVKAEALREAAEDFTSPASISTHLTPESRRWLRARADRLTAEGGADR